MIKGIAGLATIFLMCLSSLFGEERPLKVLHLTFHRGCEKEFEAVAKILSLDLTTWFIPTLPPLFFDEIASGNALYSVGHERAERVWNKHKEFFETFDAILTSDTAPLSRIFLQNEWKKPLIIWICNRFDYCDQASRDCVFPDEEYYRLFSAAKEKNNVSVVAYTQYEHYYAKTKGVATGSRIIQPTGLFIEATDSSPIPPDVVRGETFFLPPYHNETIFMNLADHFSRLGIKNYCGRYNGSKDLEGFKGIIHLPYAWSNLALFENLQLGIPYFIPSIKFLKTLIARGDYFDSNMRKNHLYHLSEWYSPENAKYFIYFDSWEELVQKTREIDLASRREIIKQYAKEHAVSTLDKWKEALNLQN